MTVKVGLTGTGVVAVVGLLVLAYLGTRGAAAARQAIDDAAQAVSDGIAAAGDYARQAVIAPDGAVGTAVGAVGAVVGLPTPSQTVDDPGAVRWIADSFGWFTASKWATAGALFSAMGLPNGSGVPPAPDSPAGRALGVTAADVARSINRGG